MTDENKNLQPSAENDTEGSVKKNVKKDSLSRRERKKRLKYGSLSVVLTAVVIAIIVVVNVLVSVVVKKIPSASIDTTEQQYYEISDTSKDYLKTLSDYKLKITFIGSKQELSSDQYYSKITALAEKYEQYTPSLEVEYVDKDKNPGFAANYDNITLTNGDAIVSCGDRYRHLSATDFLIEQENEDGQEESTDSSTTTQYNLNTEYALTMAIMVVTASDNPKATVIMGHGEKQLEKLEKLLVSNGFEVNSQNIIKEIDSESNLLVIAAPTKDFSETDLKKLDDFLYNGGKYGKNIMYVADYSQPELPGIEAFLHDWGIVLESGVVYESDSSVAYANKPYLCSLDYIDTNVTLSIAQSEATAYGFCGRPATIAKVLDVNMENSIVLQYSDTSKAGTVKDGNFIAGDGESKAYVAMTYTSLLKNAEDMSTLQSSLLFVNSTGFFEGDLFERSSSANPDVTMSLINAALGRGNSINIPTKTTSAAALGITQVQANIIGVAVTIVLPILLLGICLFVYIRRRFL